MPMLASPKNSRRAILLKAFVLYSLLVGLLLWLLPPPSLFEFFRYPTGRMFTCTTQSALVRFIPAVNNSISIQDHVIERIELPTGNRQQIPLNAAGQSLEPVSESVFSLDGSILVVLHASHRRIFSVWDGRTGQLRFVRESYVTSPVTSIACSPDGKRIAFIPPDDYKAIDILDATTGKTLGRLTSSAGQLGLVMSFSLDGRLLFSSPRWALGFRDKPPPRQMELFDTETMTLVQRFTPAIDYSAVQFTSNSLGPFGPIPSTHGCWFKHWYPDNDKLTITYLDGHTGKETELDPSLTLRYGGNVPYSSSDQDGHLYLIQPFPNPWRNRISGWLKQIGITWENADQIQVRQISPDRQRILHEQSFSAQEAAITPDGRYLILTSDGYRKTVYCYPTTFNWFHSLLWPLLPTHLYLLLKLLSVPLSPPGRGVRGEGNLNRIKPC